MTLRALVFVVIAMLLFGVVPPSVRLLSDTMTPFQIVFIRAVFGIAAIGAWFLWSGVHQLKTRRPVFHVFRASANFIGMVMWFWALKHVALAKGVAIHFTMPLFIVMFAVMFLGERIGVRRMVAVLAGFAGVLIILRPGVIEPGLPEFAILGSAALYGVATICVKVLVREEVPLAVTFHTNLIMGILCLVPTVFTWAPITMDDVLPIIGLGVFGMIPPALIAIALKTMDASLMSAFDFLRLPFTAAFAFALFGEVPDLFVWIGAAIIFFSVWNISVREARLRRQSGKSE